MTTADAERTAELLPFTPLARTVAGVLAAKAAGRVTAPERLHMPLPGAGVLLAMPASDGEMAVTKLVTLHPGNADKGLPLLHGEVVAMCARTGRRLGMLDGPEATARRTAAATLLAATRLAPHPGGELLVLGAGVQAMAHALAFAEGLGVERVHVCSLRLSRAEAMADRLSELGIPATAVASAEEAAARASLIVAATTSPTPVVPENVREDAFIAAVGSFHADRAEVPAALVRRCRLFVDDLDAARTEAGDLILAGADWKDVTPLEAVTERLELTGPVFYKSVGHASLDLAAARLAFGHLL
ncbi:delta(1)-pyrroline-2-carboxylate reductase family protein [Fundidesulfovibrio agrisoli]|uniref:delta(1)-pyrroline-2-carboxylate reductase family protein n=1 Tax=Fundidesulfovibrio agrisoli TaxID=2922717 RepID=UPI001FAD9F0E|nr:delta(1)-pyrroline-2-carboxylate reductase family protein [Fundidesulfovibrio agrisoli]